MLQSQKISEVMTPDPITINGELTIDRAEKLMFENKVRHLPVLIGGKIFGILSERDLQLAQTFKDVMRDKTLIREVCTQEPFTVSPNAPLIEVCKEMVDHRYGSVLIAEKQEIKGIFTWVDGLKALLNNSYDQSKPQWVEKLA